MEEKIKTLEEVWKDYISYFFSLKERKEDKKDE